jgi:hypothetical protein
MTTSKRENNLMSPSPEFPALEPWHRRFADALVVVGLATALIYLLACVVTYRGCRDATPEPARSKMSFGLPDLTASRICEAPMPARSVWFPFFF